MLFEKVAEYLREDDWKFQEHFEEGRNRNTITCGVKWKNSSYECVCVINEYAHNVIFYVRIPNQAPDTKRLLIAELITRANYGLTLGNFEMDFSDGEIRYKASLNLGENDELSSAAFLRLVYSAIGTADKYFPALMSVTFANVSPEQAIDQVERE